METAAMSKGKGRPVGRPKLYGEVTVRRTIDLPDSLHKLLQRRVAEENFRHPHAPISVGQLVVDLLYEGFRLPNPKQPRG